jgi:hypothetical protein
MDSSWLPRRAPDYYLTAVVDASILYGPQLMATCGRKTMSLQDMHAMWPEIRRWRLEIRLVQTTPVGNVVHFFKRR